MCVCVYSRRDLPGGKGLERDALRCKIEIIDNVAARLLLKKGMRPPYANHSSVAQRICIRLAAYLAIVVLGLGIVFVVNRDTMSPVALCHSRVCITLYEAKRLERRRASELMAFAAFVFTFVSFFFYDVLSSERRHVCFAFFTSSFSRLVVVYVQVVGCY